MSSPRTPSVGVSVCNATNAHSLSTPSAGHRPQTHELRGSGSTTPKGVFELQRADEDEDEGEDADADADKDEDEADTEAEDEAADEDEEEDEVGRHRLSASRSANVFAV